MANGQIQVRPTAFRIEGQSALVHGHGAVKIHHLFEQRGAVDQCIQEIRLQRNGLLVALQRLLHAPHALEQDAAVGPCLRIGGPQRNGAFIGGQCIGKRLQLAQCIATIQAGDRHIRLALQSPIKGRYRVLPARHIVIGQPQAMPTVGIAGLKVQGFAVGVHRQKAFTGVPQRVSAVAPGLGEIRLQGNCPVVTGQGLLGPPQGA